MADLKKRISNLVDHFGTPLGSRLKPEDKWTRLILLHHPSMDSDLVHGRNLDPVIVIRDRQQLAGQLLVTDALRSDDKTDIWRQREQLVEEVIKLIDALRVAPNVIESIDDEVEPLSFAGEVGCGNPDGGPQLVGIVPDACHGFRISHIELMHQRGRNLDERDAVVTGVFCRQKVVVSRDGRALLLKLLRQIAEVGALPASGRSPKDRDRIGVLRDACMKGFVEGFAGGL
jgi:hypothetical protein